MELNPADPWNQQPAYIRESDEPIPTSYPAYLQRPGRWDVLDPNNRQAGETPEQFQKRCMAVARFWADEDRAFAANAKLNQQAQTQADKPVVTEDDKRKRNRDAQARFRQRQQGLEDPEVQAAHAAYEDACWQREQAIDQWDQYVNGKKLAFNAVKAAYLARKAQEAVQAMQTDQPK